MLLYRSLVLLLGSDIYTMNESIKGRKSGCFLQTQESPMIFFKNPFSFFFPLLTVRLLSMGNALRKPLKLEARV